MELEVEEQSQRYVNNMLQVDNKLEVSFDQKDSLHHDPQTCSVASSNDFKLSVENQIYEFEVKIEDNFEKVELPKKKNKKNEQFTDKLYEDLTKDFWSDNYLLNG